MTQSLISLNKKWYLESKNPTKSISKKDRKEEADACQLCDGYRIECSYCIECRNPIQKSCIKCGTRTWVDTHEFCYCQLEVLVPPQRIM